MLYNLTKPASPRQGSIPITNATPHQQSLPVHSTATSFTPSLHQAVLKPIPATPSHAKNREKSKRKQVKNACVNCQKACKKCDDGRACQRCIKLGLTATCVDSPRKERRKGMKRGPYKKRQQDEERVENEKPNCLNAVVPSFTSASGTSASGIVTHGTLEGWYYNPEYSYISSHWPDTNPAYMVPHQLGFSWESSRSSEIHVFDQFLLPRDVPLMTTTSSSSSSPTPPPTTPPSLPITSATSASSYLHHSSLVPAQQHLTMLRSGVLSDHPSRAAASQFNSNKSTMNPLVTAASVHVDQQPYNHWTGTIHYDCRQ